jgi:hypothetical protein
LLTATALLVESALATAQPRDVESHIEAVIRVGISSMTTENNLGPAPAGHGPGIDGELGWRSPHLSVSAFGSFSTLRTQTDANDQDTDRQTDARFSTLDLGWRANVHMAGSVGPIAGVGLAAEIVRESGRASQCYCANNFCDPCTPTYSNQPYTQWSVTPLFEVHVGGTLPKTGPIALELLALIGFGMNPDDHGYSLTTERFTIGARF